MDCHRCNRPMALVGHTDWLGGIYLCPWCGWRYIEEWEPVDDEADELAWLDEDDDRAPRDGLPF